VVDEPNDVWMGRQFALYLEASLEQLGRAGMLQPGSAQATHNNHVLSFICRQPNLSNCTLSYTFVQQISTKSLCHLLFFARHLTIIAPNLK
jgi:hypothetical protein